MARKVIIFLNIAKKWNQIEFKTTRAYLSLANNKEAYENVSKVFGSRLLGNWVVKR
jgi:hypothetical protein